MKNYLLPAAIDDLCKRILDVYDNMSVDLKLDRERYVQYYADMAHHLFIAKSYTRFSDLLRDVESGRWNLVLLDQVDEEGILVWLEEINDRAFGLLEEARDKAMKGESESYNVAGFNVTIRHHNQ